MTSPAPRNVDFNVVFPDQLRAERFAKHFRDRGYKVSVKLSKVQSDFPWDVLVVKNMIPSHRGITEFESVLQELANTLGVQNDGWGCFAGPSEHIH